MPPIARPKALRAHEALGRLAGRGGAAQLPCVLTSRDAVPLLGRTWFMEMLQRGQLPGVQIVPGGVWRCDREAFLIWLKELRDADPTALEFAGRPCPPPGPPPGVASTA
jgi:hypothetical protein